MGKVKKIKGEIEKKKIALDKALNQKDYDLIHEDIIKISKELDELIVNYYFKCDE